MSERRTMVIINHKLSGGTVLGTTGTAIGVVTYASVFIPDVTNPDLHITFELDGKELGFYIETVGNTALLKSIQDAYINREEFSFAYNSLST